MAKRLGLKSYVMPDTAFTHPHLPLAASADAIGTPEENVVIQRISFPCIVGQSKCRA